MLLVSLRYRCIRRENWTPDSRFGSSQEHLNKKIVEKNIKFQHLFNLKIITLLSLPVVARKKCTTKTCTSTGTRAPMSFSGLLLKYL
jgi:hypothetical protein